MKAIVFIPLTQGKVAVIDFEDFEKVRPYKWQAHRTKTRWYATRTFGKRFVKMHRFLLDAAKGNKVDHRDGDGLNNRRDNLRECSNAENCRAFRKKWSGSTSKFRGVSWHKSSSSWVSQLCFNGKVFHLGCFKHQEDAARAYDKKAKEIFGEFAQPNFSE